MEEDKHHPTKCGFFLYLQGDTVFGDLIVAQEAWKGAFEYGYVKAELVHLARDVFNRLIYILGPEDKNRTLVGPPVLVKGAIKLIAELEDVELTNVSGEPK